MCPSVECFNKNVASLDADKWTLDFFFCSASCFAYTGAWSMATTRSINCTVVDGVVMVDAVVDSVVVVGLI